MNPQNILKELKADLRLQIAQNLPTLISGGAALAGGLVSRLPIPGPVGILVKKAAGYGLMLVAGTLTRMAASPADPANSPIQAKLRGV